MKINFKNKLSSTQIIALGFFVTIFLGSILLMLPIAHNGELTYLDSLFTATSATCVTGHSTVDVESTFTLFGQIIIMLLVQIGGLGFMLIIALILLVAGKRITLKERILISQTVNKNDYGGVVKLLKKIIKYTLVFELLGALALATKTIPEFGLGKRFIYRSISFSIGVL